MARSLTAVARELQGASNRLALVNRNTDRDTILRTLYAGQSKGDRAARRLEADAIAARALQRDVDRLRTELGNMLDKLDTGSSIRQ